MSTLDQELRAEARAAAELLEANTELAGWAYTGAARASLCSFVPGDAYLQYLKPYEHGDEPPSAMFTWWEPPSRFALPSDACSATVDRAASISATTRQAGPPPPDGWYDSNGQGSVLTITHRPEFAATVKIGVELLRAANALWWRYDLASMTASIIRYREGDHMLRHTDMRPGQTFNKCALSVQLSDGDSYEGGDLVMSPDAGDVAAPRTRGTAVAFSSWIPHEITRIGRGERWSLVVWAYGPPFR